PADNLPTRKPGVGMLGEFFSEEYDLKNSYVIGDRLTDVQLAKNLGSQGILLNNGTLNEKLKELALEAYCPLITESWEDIYKVLLTPNRKASVQRKTKE